MPNRAALTLVELLVVLLILGLSSALVAPSLIFPDAAPPPPFDALLERAVGAAAAREQLVELVVEPDGRWRLAGRGLAGVSILDEGSLDVAAGRAFTLVVSPLGTCGAEPGREPPFTLDPLTCTRRSPASER